MEYMDSSPSRLRYGARQYFTPAHEETPADLQMVVVSRDGQQAIETIVAWSEEAHAHIAQYENTLPETPDPETWLDRLTQP